MRTDIGALKTGICPDWSPEVEDHPASPRSIKKEMPRKNLLDKTNTLPKTTD
jgi:hypothetical protein